MVSAGYKIALWGKESRGKTVEVVGGRASRQSKLVLASFLLLVGLAHTLPCFVHSLLAEGGEQARKRKHGLINALTRTEKGGKEERKEGFTVRSWALILPSPSRPSFSPYLYTSTHTVQRLLGQSDIGSFLIFDNPPPTVPAPFRSLDRPSVMA